MNIEDLDLELGTPVNALTGKPYSGKNVETLAQAQYENGFPTSEWVTFKQALELGRCVRKGEKASARIMKVVPKKKGETDDAPKADAKGKKRRNVVKTYAVFNVAQTEALPAEKAEKKADTTPDAPTPASLMTECERLAS